jgi:hypothetical protein
VAGCLKLLLLARDQREPAVTVSCPMLRNAQLPFLHACRVLSKRMELPVTGSISLTGLGLLGTPEGKRGGGGGGTSSPGDPLLSEEIRYRALWQDTNSGARALVLVRVRQLNQ